MANDNDEFLCFGVFPGAEDILLADKQLPGDQPQAGASRTLELFDDGQDVLHSNSGDRM